MAKIKYEITNYERVDLLTAESKDRFFSGFFATL